MFIKKKILFIIGSPNQTSQMHQIASHLADYDCFFTQFYTENPIGKFLIWSGAFNNTIIWGKFKRKADEYLVKHNLQNDYKAKLNKYDLVFCCTDLVIPSKFNNVKKVWIQEGMIDSMTWWSKLVHLLQLPEYFAGNTSLNGTSNKCDLYFTASDGYSSHIASMGTESDKIIATGIPNFDNAAQYLNNEFPHQNYVFVCTSDIRELGGVEDRLGFIQKCIKIAEGRRLIFKLHPNEKFGRAKREIRKLTPTNTLVFQNGNTNEMVANCDELITQWSSVVYVGIALGKKVHSNFDLDTLLKLSPIQNNGTSSKKIAEIAKSFIEFEGPKNLFIRPYKINKNSDIKTTSHLEFA